MQYNLYKIHPDANPFAKEEADSIMEATQIEDSDVCTWSPGECANQAVRLATFTHDGRHFSVKYLCEDHKQMGCWHISPW